MTDERTPRAAPRAVSSAPDQTDELVERLIRLAEPGPELPAGGLDRLRAAVRPRWQAEVRARTRRRAVVWASGGLAAAACVVLALAITLGPAQDSPTPLGNVATIISMTGALDVLPPQGKPVERRPGELGIAVVAGSWLWTGDSDRAALRLTGGQSLRLDTDTRVRMTSARSFDLDRGAVYVESEGGDASGLEVRTSMGVARDVGTQFEVRREDRGLSVRVREGSVSLTRGDDELVIRQGLAVTVAQDGSRRTAAIATYDPSWNWVQEVAPPFEIEGRTVVAFLDWVASETGLWVTFSDPEVERFASTTVLHGTIEGLTPNEAPEVVLPGCGLTPTRGPGTLTIGRPQSGPNSP